MKPKMFVFSMLVAGFLLGCQDNGSPISTGEESSLAPSSNRSFGHLDPEAQVGADEEAREIDKKDERKNTGIAPFAFTEIPLNDLLRDPRPIHNSFYYVSGHVSVYSCFSGVSKNGQPILAVQVEPDAVVWFYESRKPSWSVRGHSVDTLRVAKGEFVLFDNSYEIEGMPDGLYLHVRFRIIPNVVAVEGVWLELAHTTIQIKD